MNNHNIPEASAGYGVPEAWAARMGSLALRQASYLLDYAEERRAAGENVLPPQEMIFRALELTPPDNVRCVILGQDPYHTPGVANGLAFSANPGCKIPPSLRNIFKELSSDLGCPMPTSPDLTPWAAQGVLLLNTILTVRAGNAGSHAKWGWQTVTGEILRVCQTLPQPVMFLLWGRHAQTAAQNAGIPLAEWNQTFSESPGGAKSALLSTHPSPLGASKGSPTLPAFIGSRPFSKTNDFLRAFGSPEISWALP